MSATITKPQRVELRERTNDVGGRVDRQSGIIYGVRVIGQQSRNGRTYTEQALRDAVRLYEGAAVFFDHEDRSPEDKSSRDLFGELRNARFENGAVRADLHYLRSHPAAEQITEAAERMPHRFGLSHHADGRTVRRDGSVIVESIEVVHSVDIVSRPATNRGLFEAHSSKGKQLKLNPKLKDAVERIVNGALAEMDVGTSDRPIESDPEDDSETMADLSGDEQAVIAILRSDKTPDEKRTELEKLLTAMINSEGDAPPTDQPVKESFRRQTGAPINFRSGLNGGYSTVPLPAVATSSAKPVVTPATLQEAHHVRTTADGRINFRSGFDR